MNCPWCKSEVDVTLPKCPYCKREINALLDASICTVARHQQKLLWVALVRVSLLLLTVFSNTVSFYYFENAWVGVTPRWATFTFWSFLATGAGGITITIYGAIVLKRLMRASRRAPLAIIAGVTLSLFPIIGIFVLIWHAALTKIYLGGFGITVGLFRIASKFSEQYQPQLAPASFFRGVTVFTLLVLAYWGPIRHYLVERWLVDGNWSHGWLIPLFSVYFLVTRREELARCTPKPNYFGAVVLAFSLTAYFWAAWRARMAYPQSLSLVGTIFGVTLLLGGWSVMRIAWFPIAFLFLAIPLPKPQYVELTRPLRELASTAAAAVMPMFLPGLHTQAQAVVIDYVRPGMAPGQLNVEEACSGMRLMMAFVTLGVAMAYLGDRPLWQRIIMVASCLPIAVLCNTIRVTTTGLLTITGHAEYAQGTPHQLLGMVMLLLALGCYALIGYILSHLIIEAAEEKNPLGASTGN